jgi:endonuclease/exonuclease/phosphatase family metal-dependent hydrolase
MCPPRKRSPLVSIALALGILVTACGPAEATLLSSSAPVSARAVDPGNAGGNKFLTVMTRNLFVGGDIFAPFAPDVPPDQVLDVAAQVFVEIQHSNFPLRAQAIADEIAAAGADLVGLQEVFRFEATPFGATEPEVLDFLEHLLDALAARGLAYEVASVQPQTSLTLPLPALGATVTLLDRDVILAHPRIDVRASDGGTFDTRVATELAGVEIEITRGWTSATVKKQGVELLFVNTHLEVRNISPLVPPGLVQLLQAQELLEDVIGTRDRVILVGDLNSDPDQPIAFWTYGLVTGPAGGFADAWLTRNEPGTGPTCCFDSIRDPDAELSERVDLVLLRGAMSTLDAYRVGHAPDDLLEDALGPLWPSDHAGVVATLRLENPKFFAVR